MNNSPKRELLYISAVDLLGSLTVEEIQTVIDEILSILFER